MRVLVVGGSGFVGGRVLDALLAAGHEVLNLDVRASARHVGISAVGDVRDSAAVEAAMAGRDAVIVLAATHIAGARPTSLYESVNVGGAQIVTEAAQAAGVRRAVFVSSGAVYGPGRTGGAPAAESTPPQPADEAARTKLAAEQVFQAWATGDPQRALTVLRPATVFGEDDPRVAPDTLPGLIAPMLRRGFVLPGRGAARRSLAYVGNLADLVVERLAAGPGTTVLNVADKPDLSTADLATAVRGAAGRTPPRRLPVPVALLLAVLLDAVARLLRRPAGRAEWVRAVTTGATLDTTALDALGHRPAVGFDEAFERTLSSLRRDPRR